MKITSTILLLLISFVSFSQPQLEVLDRGLLAVNMGDTAVYLGWRLFGDEPKDKAFNIYRIDNGATGEKINAEPIVNTTNYIDSIAPSEDFSYCVVPLDGDNEQAPSDTVTIWGQNYLSVPLQIPSAESTHSYTANDASVGDLDGDGEYEIVLKWDPTNSKDNSQPGVTGKVYLDAYEMDGTLLWRIDLGINIRAGAHYTQFIVYDLDGDGIAEVSCKTAPGTKDGSGSFISDGPASSANHSADYRNSDGYILEGPEYLTVFSGEDGAELSTVDYIPERGVIDDWGDGYGNRIDRFLATPAYLDGTNASLVMCRGYYTRSVLAAWDFQGGELTQRWVFDTDDGYPNYAGQGNHAVTAFDVDQDGKQEIIYGGMAVDDDGTPMWTTGLGHGDAMHVTDLMPERPGIEKWGIHEGDGPGSALLDAVTGEVLWQTANADIGRGVAADLTAENYGMEMWGGTDGLVNGYNQRVGDYPSSSNHVVWWDGDLLRELLNDIYITKYNGGVLLEATGCASNNGTKSNPALQADLFGDWREEVMWRTTDNSALRIYTTTDYTKYRIPTLMHDMDYRIAIAWQNVAYNQSPHTSFYLGDGMFIPDEEIPPSKVRGLLVPTETEDYIELKWEANYEGDIEGYNIYRSDDSTEEFSKINNEPVEVLTYRDSTISIEVIYTYYVTAMDMDGNESIPSDEVNGLFTNRPDSPQGLFTSAGNQAVFVKWNPVADASGYNVYRKNSGEEFTKLNTEILEATQFVDLELENLVEYTYAVTSVDEEELESFNSQEVSEIPSEVITIQAESASIEGGAVESNHIGFNGDGFVNLGSSGSITFNHIFGSGNAAMLIYRWALGAADGRTGSLGINGESQSLTMEPTGAWNNYIEDSILVQLEAGFDNTIQFSATGADFGNLDQITLKSYDQITSVNQEFEDSNKVNIFPNPVTGSTTIKITNQFNRAFIEIINDLGISVKKFKMLSGEKGNVVWDGTSDSGNRLSAGIYFCRVSFLDQQSIVKRIVLTN